MSTHHSSQPTAPASQSQSQSQSSPLPNPSPSPNPHPHPALQTLPPQPTVPTTTTTADQPILPHQRTAEARTAFTASLHSAAANLDSDLQSRAKNIHANALALKKQERDVEREVKGLRGLNEEMEGVVGGWGREWSREVGNGGGGGLGVEEFDLGGLERELGVLEEWVRIVEEEEEEEEDEEVVGGKGDDGGDMDVEEEGEGRGGDGQEEGEGKGLGELEMGGTSRAGLDGA